jgi:hypothetical protein
MATMIAYNLGNLWQRLALPRAVGIWSLTSLQQRLVKPATVQSNTPAITPYYYWRRAI